MTTLIICESNFSEQQQLEHMSEKTLFAAAAISGEKHVLWLDENLNQATQNRLAALGVSHIFTQALPAHDAKAVADAVYALANNYRHILMPASSLGKDVIPRLGAKLDITPLSEIIEIVDENTFKRNIYAGDAIATLRCETLPILGTVRAASFSEVSTNAVAEHAVKVSALPPHAVNSGVTFGTLEHNPQQGVQLADAQTVIAGGKGLDNAENFMARLSPLAKQLNAAIGASRAAVDAGFCPNEYQVGQTGQIIAPKLYFAVAISGAQQHLAGIKEAGTIVAINQDENAPIMAHADYQLIGDANQLLPELSALLTD